MPCKASLFHFALVLVLGLLTGVPCTATKQQVSLGFVVSRLQRVATAPSASKTTPTAFTFPVPLVETSARSESMILICKRGTGLGQPKMAANDDRVNTSLEGKRPESPPPATINPALNLIGKTTSVVVSVTFFAFLSIRRDAFMLTFFLGAIGNGILSKVLKKILNHERPAELHQNEMIKLKPSDGGMPSSHAMSLGFICTWVALEVVHTLPWLVGVLAVYVFSSLYYRVLTKLHTVEQVLVGLAVGVTNGAVWRHLSFGTFRMLPSVNVVGWVSTHLLPESGTLPPVYLLIPAVVGAAVVGSFERRLSMWLKSSSTSISTGGTKDSDASGKQE